MQAITPVDVRVGNDWRNGINIKSNLKTTATRKDRQTPRIRTKVVNKPKIKKKEFPLAPKPRLPKQVVNAKIASPVRSRSSSPSRGPWVPPPGRASKAQNYSWQGSKARLEITPVTEISIDDESSLYSERNRHNTSLNSPTNTFSTVENEKLMNDIEVYENRIQGLIDGIGMLKERIHKHADQEQTDQLRSDIDSSLFELEHLQDNYTQQRSSRTTKLSRSKSFSPIRSNSKNDANNNRSSSLDQRRRRTTTPRVTFQDDPINKKFKRTKGPININPDREQLLISLAQSESDIAQITKHICSVKDILVKLKFDDQPVSFEIEQLYQHRNELLYLIEQFERSNKKLVEYLRHQYHLEVEQGLISDKHDTLTTQIHELKYENERMRRLLLERENDNIALQTEIERTRTQAINFDTMKTSLEHNRAHLQRELYAREGEINRLQCALRALERDLQRSRYHYGPAPRSIRSSSSSSSTHIGPKTKALTIERLQAALDDRDQQIHDLKNQLSVDKDSEILFLRTKLQQVEHVANEYKAQLHTQTLKSSANNSRNHLSEVELEKTRTRLQKRIEDLEPLPTLLKQEEVKNEKLQKQINDLQKRLSEQSNFHTQPFSPIDNNNDNNRSLQQRLNILEEENDKLLKTLHAKEEEIRILQVKSRVNSKTYDDITSIHKHNDLKPIDIKIRDDTINSKTSTFDLEQQLTRVRLEYKQLKREKDEVERRFTLQINELREKLEHSNNTNRSLQNYINSFKTTYATLFNDTLPTSLTRYTTT